MRTKRQIGWVSGMLVAVISTCASAETPLTYYGFDETSYSTEAREGLHAIYSGRLFHEGVPATAGRMMVGVLNNFLQQSGFESRSVEGTFYATGRLPSPPDRVHGNDPSFALAESVFDRDGLARVNFNCFNCHAGVVHGQVVAGLGNSHINQSDARRSRTRGDNFGPYEVWRLSSRLEDPANKGLVIASKKTTLQELFESVELPPVDPMPWWLMKYKTKDYWYADAGPHDAASFSINFTTPHPDMNADHGEHVKIVAKALAFARETQSPLFPGTLDAGLVQTGADLFHGRVRPTNPKGFRKCMTCHGTYTKKPTQPDLSQPGSWTVDYDYSHVLRDVKTDGSYNATLQKFAPIADHIGALKDYYIAKGTPELATQVAVPAKPGYVAPPLVGVWASAPYFHNGSVPTIATVLNSKNRPEIWSRNHRDPHAYDLESVGMPYQPVSRSEFDRSAAEAEGKNPLSQAVIDHAALYDTTAFGHGNTGHTFGDNLTEEERLAVIEFLKSLSGPDMQ